MDIQLSNRDRHVMIRDEHGLHIDRSSRDQPSFVHPSRWNLFSSLIFFFLSPSAISAWFVFDSFAVASHLTLFLYKLSSRSGW